ncbi:Uncharacterised protein [Mycobacteroides abscessus]|nr:Uncharacterised protein [Mycobacteroides abscessus]
MSVECIDVDGWVLRDIVPRLGDGVRVLDDAVAAGIGTRDRRELLQLFGGGTDLQNQLGELRGVGRESLGGWVGFLHDVRQGLVLGVELVSQLRGLCECLRDLRRSRIQRPQ